MTETNLKRILSRVDTLPSVPGSASQLMVLIENPDTPVSEIEEILQYDPGLTANVLKLANSAYFGLPNKVGSIRQAVVLLGNAKLLQLVMTSCVNAAMNRSIPGYDLPSGELWRHSVAVSVAAEGLMAELNVDDVDVIFTAALLHDVGKLVLGEFIRDELDKIEGVAGQGVSFEIAERQILGTDHAEIGAKILEQWALPRRIAQAVRWHHNPDACEPTSTLVDIVHVANVLCLMVGIGVGREGLQYQPSGPATKRLGLKPYHLEKVASQTLQWVSEISEVIQPGN